MVRFLTLHIMMPLLLLGVIILHICVLHTYYSEIPGREDYRMKFSVLLNKDIVGILAVMWMVNILIISVPRLCIDRENWKGLDIMKTPEHIKPE